MHTADRADSEFGEFWSRYPRKVAKKDAMRAWQRLAAPQRARAMEVIEAHAAYWAKAGRTAETIPHAATWLNGWRFDDVLPERVHGRKFDPAAYARDARDGAIAEELGGGAPAAPAGHVRGPARGRTH